MQMRTQWEKPWQSRGGLGRAGISTQANATSCPPFWVNREKTTCFRSKCRLEELPATPRLIENSKRNWWSRIKSTGCKVKSTRSRICAGKSVWINRAVNLTERQKLVLQTAWKGFLTLTSSLQSGFLIDLSDDLFWEGLIVLKASGDVGIARAKMQWKAHGWLSIFQVSCIKLF